MWWRLAGFALVAVLGVATLALVPLDTETVRSEVAGAGAGGWLVFVVGYAVATLVLLPENVLSVAGGLVLGPAQWTGLVWSAAVLGAGAAFLVGRVLGRDGVVRLAGPAMARPTGGSNVGGSWPCWSRDSSPSSRSPR